MNRTQFNILLIGLSLFIGLFPSCGNKPSDDRYMAQCKYFAADESLSPIIDEELDIFNMKNKRDSIYPLYISEQEAIEKLMNQEVLLVFTTRRLTPKEEESLKELKYKPTCTELAYDALALIVNKPREYALTETMLETLAIIAYRQPVTRLDIEKIRGVKSDYAVNQLIEYGLIREAGRMNAPGKPLLFVTTDEFLRHFGLSGLEDMPTFGREELAGFRADAEREADGETDGGIDDRIDGEIPV